MRVEVTNRHKKSFEEIEMFRNSETGWICTITSGWRRGTVRFDIESMDDLNIDEECGPDSEDYELDATAFEDFEFIDSYDGCWTDISVYHPTLKEEEEDDMQEKVEEAWDEDGFSGLEELGFVSEQYEAMFYGPVDVEEILDRDKYL